MNPLHPIYTERTECQDCYKCIRECPVKAIRVTDGHAAVMEDRCILCGHCVNVCPRQAKKVRDDLGRARSSWPGVKRSMSRWPRRMSVNFRR